MEETRGESIMKKLGGKPQYIVMAMAVGLVISVALIMGILSLTVYRGKDPITMLNGVVLRDLQISQDVPKLTVDLNLSVKNPNKYAFTPTKSTAFLLYRGVMVGEVVIEVGEIAPGATKSMTVTLTILAERMQGNPVIHMDVAGGMVPFNTYTKISGKVKVFRVVGVTVISTGLCGFDIDVKSKTIGDPKCA
ncbi:unnamed protein product [Prunus armeniaca]|uniref:Late embryogenesis abundant protein LEA-2 subgroup domain-containing protein n=1 Tax=Prunus armeniaca TaxID=36596 RepID=A0A6J5XW60_PRUAR|nr:unnamed protein product [Prunus armeniaca]